MTIDPKHLTLVQWLSPSFPLGSFAFSHGLESAIAQGHVSDAATLSDWLTDVVTKGTGRSDAIWLRLAFASDQVLGLKKLDLEARAFQLSAERLREAQRQGEAFTRIANEIWGCGLPPLLLPLAVGAASRHQGMETDLVVGLYLHSFVSNLVAAAQRLMPLGQTEGQRLVSDLKQACLTVVEESRGQDFDDIHSATFLSDIMAMRHETLQPRIFQS